MAHRDGFGREELRFGHIGFRSGFLRFRVPPGRRPGERGTFQRSRQPYPAPPARYACSVAKRSRSKKGLTYAEAGVSIEAGDDAAKRYRALMRRTYGPRVILNDGGFAGKFRLDFNEQLFKKNYRDPVLVSCADGVGSKVLLAKELDVHDTVGIDLVAMNVNDLVVEGAEPLFFLDYVGVHRVVPETAEQIVAGVATGCEIAGCALLGGETAELPEVYAEGEYDLAGFAVGVVELRRATNHERVEPGDVVLGLASDGVHSNGYTLVRSIIRHAKLDLTTPLRELAGSPGFEDDDRPTLGQVLMTPTRIYAGSIVRLDRAYKVKRPITGMAHITGGGLEGNLNRALHDGVDAVVDTKAWTPPPVFDYLRKKGGVDRGEMFRVFNMGIGFTLIVRPAFADSIAARLTRLGEQVSVIGKITKGRGSVKLRHS
ncbi:MAG: phosphoribosylformylglycinamidine cyclo-ligase [Phycisphaerae bacterium]|nr:phosphoribosylformylglycinamidine cyclo-ligase [Phycisphaerae bacterium]